MLYITIYNYIYNFVLYLHIYVYSCFLFTIMSSPTTTMVTQDGVSYEWAMFFFFPMW